VVYVFLSIFIIQRYLFLGINHFPQKVAFSLFGKLGRAILLLNFYVCLTIFRPNEKETTNVRDIDGFLSTFLYLTYARMYVCVPWEFE
jgi:hypothetical protein